MANFFLGLNKTRVPLKVVSDYDSALEFIRALKLEQEAEDMKNPT